MKHFDWRPVLRRASVLLLVAALCALAWYVGSTRHWRYILLLALAAASFIAGSLAGFVLTSYADETASVGRVKDWALGALAGLTIVEFDKLRGVLRMFALTNEAADYAVAGAVAVLFAGLGFYLMFFGRELIFNVPLARNRATRYLIENTHEAGLATIRLNTAVPTGVLLGSQDADDLTKRDPKRAAALKQTLDSDDVQTFLRQSEDAVANGSPLDWDVLSKVANLHYYHAYLVDKDELEAARESALEWIARALVTYPDHVDLSLKRIDMLAVSCRYSEAVGMLENLVIRPDCPYYVEQWLGYYLLYLPGREAEALSRSRSYLSRFPDSAASLRNVARAHAQRACQQARTAGTALDRKSDDYLNAIAKLREALRADPGYLPTVQQEWSKPESSFACFLHDPEYDAATKTSAP